MLDYYNLHSIGQYNPLYSELVRTVPCTWYCLQKNILKPLVESKMGEQKKHIKMFHSKQPEAFPMLPEFKKKRICTTWLYTGNPRILGVNICFRPFLSIIYL